MTDLELSQRVSARDSAAVEAFVSRFSELLKGYLVSRCDQHGGDDKDAARDIVDQLMADCCKGELLKKYNGKGKSGKGSLEGWLKRVAYRRLAKHWRAKARNPVKDSLDRIEDGDGDRPAVRPPGVDRQRDEQANESPSGTPSVDAEEFYDRLMQATVYAFERLRSEYPEWLAVLRLAVLHQVPQRSIAAAFGVDEAEIADMKSGGVVFLQSEVSTWLAQHYSRGSFTWEDLREFARNAEDIVHDEEMAGKILEALGLG